MKVGCKSILDFINEAHALLIPPYQRNYSWDTGDARHVWGEIVAIADNVGRWNQRSDSGRFFGTLVYTKNTPDSNDYIITDGQQRLTTISLLLAALRDVCDDEKIREKCRKTLLCDDKITPKIQQNSSDKKVYQGIAVKLDTDNQDIDTKIYKNYLYFVRQIRAYLKESGRQPNRILQAIDRMEISTIELDQSRPWENPQLIFESMNSLGKNLSLADLVRNYLMMDENIKQQEALYGVWNRFESKLGDNMSNFVRDYLQIKYAQRVDVAQPINSASEANAKKLYAMFKSIHPDSADDAEVLKELANYSVYYSYIIGKIQTHNHVVDVLLEDIRRFKVEALNPFLMELLYRYGGRRIKDDDDVLVVILKAIRSYVMRRRIVGESRTIGKTNVILTKKIDELLASKTNKEAEANIFQVLSSQDEGAKLPNDTEVENALTSMNFYTFAYAKVVLAMIERKHSRLSVSALDALTIEHIMPQKLNDEWKAELGENYEDVHLRLKDNIGNLMLIGDRVNSAVSNRGFDVKKYIYTESDLWKANNENIAKAETWNEDAIKARCERMINDVCDIASIPNGMRKVDNWVENK